MIKPLLLSITIVFVLTIVCFAIVVKSVFDDEDSNF